MVHLRLGALEQLVDNVGVPQCGGPHEQPLTCPRLAAQLDAALVEQPVQVVRVVLLDAPDREVVGELDDLLQHSNGCRERRPSARVGGC